MSSDLEKTISDAIDKISALAKLEKAKENMRMESMKRIIAMESTFEAVNVARGRLRIKPISESAFLDGLERMEIN